MKKFVCLIGACYSLYSCKPPSYSYVPPTMNTTAYSRAGEGQLGFMFGSPSIGAKGGVAITKNINVNAWASTMPQGNNDDYNSKEAEFSIGIQTNPDKNGDVTSFFAGYSGGSNEKDPQGPHRRFQPRFSANTAIGHRCAHGRCTPRWLFWLSG